jgi:hypothetical protein
MDPQLLIPTTGTSAAPTSHHFNSTRQANLGKGRRHSILILSHSIAQVMAMSAQTLPLVTKEILAQCPRCDFP